MSIKIRLSRGGRVGVPFYKIVVTDSRSPRDGKFIEKVGTFNPLLDTENKDHLRIDQEKIEYWLSVGAIPSDRVASLLIKSGVKGADKYKPKFIARDKGYGAKKKAKEAMAKASEASKAA